MKPIKFNELWHGYTKSIDLAEIKRLFKARYGYEPAEIVDISWAWLAGPVEREEDPPSDGDV